MAEVWDFTCTSSYWQHHQYINFILSRKDVLPYYFESKTQFFTHFSELKIRMHLKFDVFYFMFQRSQGHGFPRRSGLVKRVVNSTDSEMHLLAKSFFLDNPFLKMGCVSN